MTVIPFVGSIMAPSGALRTAFFCKSTTMLVTCNHNLPEKPCTLIWRHFASGREQQLGDWIYLDRDEETDVAVIGLKHPSPGLPEKHEIAAQPFPDIKVPTFKVRFYALTEYTEDGVCVYEPDPGNGEILGLRGGSSHKMKMKSQYVTAGCSGAPLVIDTPVGLIVVGMISGRYNSDDNWNSHVVWAIQPGAINRSLGRAVRRRKEQQPQEISRAFLASIGVDVSEIPDDGLVV